MALRCLLVDDDARFLQSARTLLELEGIEVDTASTGAQDCEKYLTGGLRRARRIAILYPLPSVRMARAPS